MTTYQLQLFMYHLSELCMNNTQQWIS